MAFSPFPGKGYYRILESNEEAKGGYFTLTDSMDLKHIVPQIFIHGTMSGSEQVRMKIYGANGASATSTPIAVSAYAPLADIGNYTSNWLGDIFLDFSGEPLKSGVSYYMSLQIANYTRNADTFYIGVNLDWYPDVNDPVVSTTRGFRARILGYK
jgi:hypothetical protein